jgi:hypothetical protein
MSPTKNLASALRSAAETVEQLNLHDVYDRAALLQLARAIGVSFADVILTTEELDDKPVLH